MTDSSPETSEPRVAAATRFHIGNPEHTYPLQEMLPVASRLNTPYMIVIRGSDGTVTLKIPLKQGEAIWGFGQRFDAFNLRGTKLECWTTDGWNAMDTSYYAVPFFISSRGYGLFINHPGRLTFDIGVNDPNVLAIRIPDSAVELITFEGTPSAVSQRYTEIIGRPRPVPDWIYRPWISRNSYLGAYEIDRITERMRTLGMPVGVAVLEAWEEQLHNFRFTTHRYPDTANWIRRLNEKGVHIVCWITSSVWTSSEAYRQAKEKGYLVHNDDGSEHIVRWLENGRKIDFRKPEARAWWRDMQKQAVDLGVEGFKTDGGEHMPDPLFHNLHSYYYQEASLDAFRDSGRNGITFARSACSPNAGLSTFWAGDQKADWRGLQMVVRGGLSTALCGFPFWGHDIGGYSDTPVKELYIRWMQFGVFSPIMQFHGIGAREPWHYDEETLELARFYFGVREKLLPRLVQWGEEARATGTPIIRPLIWHYPDDATTFPIDNEYLLGPDLLVAPVTDPIDARGVYLPLGKWVDLWTGEYHEGPTNFLYQAPLGHIPVYVRDSAYGEYRDLFSGAPGKSGNTVLIRLAGPKNDRGIVPELRFHGDTGEPATVYFEIENAMSSNVTISVQPVTTTMCKVEPAGKLNLRLDPGDIQRVAYHVTPKNISSPDSHPMTLEVIQDGKRLPAPVVKIVSSPRWKVLGLLEGGVESAQSLDGEPVNTDGEWTGKNGQAVRWRDVPSSLLGTDGSINLESMIGNDGWSTYYLAADIPSDRARDITFHAGFGDSMTVWLNGTKISSVIGHRNAERDEDVVKSRLQPGNNRLLIRNSRDLSPSLFYFRISL